jgi:hypothetical protein
MLRHHEKLSPPQSPSLKPVLKNQPRTEETGADDVEQSVDELEGRCFGHGRNGGGEKYFLSEECIPERGSVLQGYRRKSCEWAAKIGDLTSKYNRMGNRARLRVSYLGWLCDPMSL